MNDYDVDIPGDTYFVYSESLSSASPGSITDDIEAYQPTRLNYNLLLGLIFGFYLVSALCSFVRKNLGLKKGE